MVEEEDCFLCNKFDVNELEVCFFLIEDLLNKCRFISEN